MADVRRWTPTAINCYRRGGICRGCEISKLKLSVKCQMKKSVLALVRKFGRPPDKIKLFGCDLDEGEQKVLSKLQENPLITKKEIKNDKALYTLIELCKLNGFNPPLIKNQLIYLTEFLRAKGIIEDRTMFDEDLKIELPQSLIPIAEAMKKGYSDYDNLARETGKSKHLLSVNLPAFLAKIKNQLPDTIFKGESVREQVYNFIQERLFDLNEQAKEISSSDNAPEEDGVNKPKPEEIKESGKEILTDKKVSALLNKYGREIEENKAEIKRLEDNIIRLNLKTEVLKELSEIKQ